MIKTLRITTIIVAIAATVLLILPAVYGVRTNSKIEELIKSPGTVDKFAAAKGQNPASKDTDSPLVKQAAAFGQLLNPPPPPPPKAPPVGTPQPAAAPAPPVVSAKFDLIATSYYASHPEQSFVLIDEPGKGLHWVRQGTTVGRTTIETVKDGAIIVRDGQRTSEMTVKVQEAWRSLLKNPPPSTKPGTVSTSPANPAAAPPAARPGSEPSPVTAMKPAPSNPARMTTPLPPGILPSSSDKIPSPAQPVPQATTGDKPAAELSPAEKERAAQINQLLAKTANTSDKLTEEDKANLDKLVKLLQQADSANSPDGNN